MMRMLDLRDVFELIGDGLNDDAFAQQELVEAVEQEIVHVLAQFGDEVQSLGDQPLLDQLLGEIAIVPNELAQQACSQLRNRTPIINITRGEVIKPESRLDR
jgi:hypothetical protein